MKGGVDEGEREGGAVPISHLEVFGDRLHEGPEERVPLVEVEDAVVNELEVVAHA